MTTEHAARVAAHPLWYHTIALPDGVVTPGWFDLRPIVERMPWPEIAGRRCLDIGTYDGFLAFELERRGAAEVVATDIADHDDWDWPERERRRGPAYLRHIAGDKGAGFEIAAAALGSQVRREFISVYDLDPVAIGRFDVVVCGDLLLHLRDPARALAAVRRVCRGVFLSAEQIDLRLTMLQPLRPALYVSGQLGQWFIPNHAGHARLLDVAGFDVLQQTRYAIPRGPSHPVAPPSWRERFRRLGERWVAGGEGLPTSAILCRPAA